MSDKQLIFKDRKGNMIACSVLSGAILIFLAAVIFIMPEPTHTQLHLLRFFMAVTSGLLATFFLGGIILEGSVLGAKVGAGGGFALFVLMQFVYDPLKIQAIAAENVPKIVPPRAEVRQAQESLSNIGIYSGPVDGLPDAATRDAIAKFQGKQGLPKTGYIDSSTEKAIKKSALPPVPPTSEDLFQAVKIETGNTVVSQTEVAGELMDNYKKKIWLDLPDEKARAIESVIYHFGGFAAKEKKGGARENGFEAKWIGWGCSENLKIIANLKNEETVMAKLDACELE